MAYTINRYNKTTVAVVADGTIDSTLDIKLIGKNYAGYGEVQNENFVNLLENFAGDSEPPRPISGQLWFDTDNNKLKFYDGNKFRSAGGAEISDTEPAASTLAIGDFWYDTVNNQLFAVNSTGSYTLIGPQGVAGSQTTELRTRKVTDNAAGTHNIVEALANGVTAFTISSDAEFTINNVLTNPPLVGFTKIRKGITLAYTNNDALPGQTTGTDRFWGTATNSERLGGLTAGDFVQTSQSEFGGLVKFADVGFTVGSPVAKLRVFNDLSLTPTIENQEGNTIVFKTTGGTPLKLVGANILPGFTASTNIGSAGFKFNDVYATNFYGTAEQSGKLLVGSDYRSADTNAVINTVAARDSLGYIKAVIFQGTATAANYADLAEKYLADAEYEIGTVVSVGGEKEVTACKYGDRALGAVSENPAYMMNAELEGGTYIALKGRVPVKVTGTVRKGQRLVAANDGTAVAAVPHANDVFAIALESSDDTGIKLIESVIL